MNVNAVDPLLLPQKEMPRDDKANTKSTASFAEMLNELVPKGLNPKVSSEVFSRTPAREKIIEHVGENPERKKMFEAARQFENFFLEKMFREMRKNMGKDDILHGGSAEDIFQDMLLTERVNKLTQGSTLGLAEQIYTQMQRPVTPQTPTLPASPGEGSKTTSPRIGVGREGA
ncbi:MAG: rod-binding protein [Spirochaetes bacterium]|nr:rod-binding protein [Spirochaetota bacterium]